MNLLRKILPLQFAVQAGKLTLISGTLFDFDYDHEPDEVVSLPSLPFGFAMAPVDEVGPSGLNPWRDNDDDDDDSEDDQEARRSRARAARR